MKNEAVRVFFAVIALILVALLTSPNVHSPMNQTATGRGVAAIEEATPAPAKAKPARKVIRVKKAGHKITVSWERT